MGQSARPWRRRALRALGAAALLAAAVFAALAATPLPRAEVRFSQPEWIGPVHVVDVEKGAVQRDRALRVRNGRIAAIVELARVPAAARAGMTDAGGAYVMPALTDMHAVLTRYSPALEQPLALAHGITRQRSILNCPAEGAANLYACQSDKQLWNQDIRSGGSLGALTMASGSYPVTGPARPYRDAPRAYSAATPAEARALVRLVAGQRLRPDHIKTYDGVPRASFFALMEEARRLGIEVSGHVPAAVAVAEASAAGLKAIAHARALPIGCSSREADIMRLRAAGRPAAEWMELALRTQDGAKCARLWAVLKRNGTFVSPTLITRFSETRAGMAELSSNPTAQAVTPGLIRFLWSEDVAALEARSAREEALYARFYAAAAARTAEAQDAGVLLLVGSDTNDAWVAPGIGLHQEMALWRRAGIPVRSILRAATVDAAAYFGRAGDMGRVRPGHVADLVFTVRNPLEDVATLRRPLLVMQEGRLYSRATLDGAVEVAERTAASWRYPAHFLRDLLRNPLGFAG